MGPLGFGGIGVAGGAGVAAGATGTRVVVVFGATDSTMGTLRMRPSKVSNWLARRVISLPSLRITVPSVLTRRPLGSTSSFVTFSVRPLRVISTSAPEVVIPSRDETPTSLFAADGAAGLVADGSSATSLSVSTEIARAQTRRCEECISYISVPPSLWPC